MMDEGLTPEQSLAWLKQMGVDEVIFEEPQKRDVMKLERIKYERLFSLPNFENIKVGAEALVEEGEDKNACFRSLANFVESQRPNLNNQTAQPQQNSYPQQQGNNYQQPTQPQPQYQPHRSQYKG